MSRRRVLGATKIDAHVAVKRARDDGILPRQPPFCEACGTEGQRTAAQWSIQYHHHSHLPEHHLDVTALCRRCHGLVHAGKLPQPVPRLYSAAANAARAEALGPVHRLRPTPVVA